LEHGHVLSKGNVMRYDTKYFPGDIIVPGEFEDDDSALYYLRVEGNGHRLDGPIRFDNDHGALIIAVSETTMPDSAYAYILTCMPFGTSQVLYCFSGFVRKIV
jgi:hypothetical protein